MKTDKKYVDLEHPSYYNNRELSWLAFNKRVLQEAMDNRNPLLERLKFISIFSSNLDEFFMVRVAGLKDQVKAGFNKPDNKSSMTPMQQLKAISQHCHHLVALQDELFNDSLLPRLKEEGVEFWSMNEISHEQYNFLSRHFDEYILPVLTPMAIDACRPFPMLLNKSLNLAVLLEADNEPKENGGKLAIVQVPSVLNRVVPLPSMIESEHCFILLEQVISHFIYRLFYGNKVISVSPFRITRNADFEIHEESVRDLLKEMEKEIKKQKWGSAVRLEMQQDKMDSKVLSFLKEALELQPDDIYAVKGPVDYTFLSAFVESLVHIYEHLFHEALVPQPPADLKGEDDLFEAIVKNDILLHHPFESFEPIVEFIEKAAEDPNVLAIKQTLYRVSGESPIIRALAEAANAGKQVTVLVELKARFDEESNIRWAKKLEKAGAHVIYGITGLKTHSKITLVIRQQHGVIQRFVHLGTGNYNDTTAKFYTDLGLLTAKESFGKDATHFFNHLSGYSSKPAWNEIATAPLDIREQFLALIDAEMKYQAKYKNGKMIAKMNSLTDKAIILKLFEASQAGVKIELIIRGICCLKPGINGVSENITVRSIVGRFLEHSRIYYFHQNGAEAIYLSSADWMTRNMEKRIEILFPIYQQVTKNRIIDILQTYLKDNVKARIQQPDGDYQYVETAKNESPFESQVYLYKQARQNSH
ncbi:polyphosphate kinase [Evansella caseinilytica]|uniref:Polyphosphate kinase n=1 Tax=Evansella caseinilytica TaxID=1503961 RepID=A0A1H3KMI3_9BACI|nr:RNA degradosome polyphosphate kinase [Evansella caseinilytica]SDY52938.1 polyphosphate kinase [Evansella caseinilytica]